MSTTLLRGPTIVHAPETDGSDPTTGRHRRVDVRLRDGVVVEVADRLDPIGPEGAERSGPSDERREDVVDLDGWLLLPAPVEPHAHLDKAFLAERVVNETGDLLGAIRAMGAARHLLGVDETIERAERAARLMAANGYVAVRTHADTTVDHGLRSIEALTEVKRRCAGVIDVEIVALCGWPVVGPDRADQRALLRDAVDAGADLVGGVPHLEEDGRAATEFLLGVATDTGRGVDLHTDETLDPDSLDLVDLCDAVEAGFELPVTASHCVSLGMQDDRDQRRIAERVAAAGIGIVALPHTNLFLQGRGRAPMPRGLTAVAALLDAGATVAAGADNLRDPFNPVGRACPFETAGLAILTAHLLPHRAWHSVSTAAADVLGRSPGAIEPGAPADLLAVESSMDEPTVREAIATGPPRRRRWVSGVESNVEARER